ncbi:hypothetical protein PPERSA_02420 [Pseudocohnilembus persalinus]|uniref:Uncharacterized protein n=1 Tax=Pseudocohnilembus persalinus TaxID=266149 RepID=A0A0V0QAP0_PSEPJ|nr:hypothetical protein PPERSA_02420 [Pseudocohnilembus persalinus]|eukprot:KRW99308.1 hypothetical protein PPERSA_02420 [Pseudocohnilembus persalinus]
MFEGSRLSYVVPGYTGYIPKEVQYDRVQVQEQEPTYQIPGYAGYTTSIKSENMFGKTYGQITYNLSKGDYQQGQDIDPEERYQSMYNATYVNQDKVLKRTAAEIVGVPNHQNKYYIDRDQIQNNRFWGNDEQGKETIQGASQSQQEQFNNGQKSYQENVKDFYGDDDKKSIRMNEPLPGYTGVSRRVQAANIFGQTYANARKTAGRDQSQIDMEKTQNFKSQSTIHPPIRR